MPAGRPVVEGFKKNKYLTIRVRQDILDKLAALATDAGESDSVTLRAIIRAANVDLVRRGIRHGQRRGL
jgi:hypothetical protein